MSLHALLLWVGMPVCLAAQNLIPPLRPTCVSGFSNWSFLLLLLVEAHHIYQERKAWTAVRDLITPPELSVMRQLGILRMRLRHVILGILEDVDLYMDFAFPFVALACDRDDPSNPMTEHWAEAWRQVPILGHFLAKIVLRVRFWGVAFFFAGLNVAVCGLLRLASMSRDARSRETETNRNTGEFRLSGSIYFMWARAAETAMMPSVAGLCEEMALQKRWVFDTTKLSVTARATQAREDYEFGKVTSRDLQQSELHAVQEEERVQEEEESHVALVLLSKVLVGNVMALWLQGSFVALTYQDSFNDMSLATVKLLISMVISAAQAALRCWRASCRLGVGGAWMSVMVMSFVFWSFLKVYYAKVCPYHLWNLTTGCVGGSDE